MVSVSPRLPNLDSDEEPECCDHRFAFGFRSLSLETEGYSDFEHPDDARPFAGTPDSSASRRRRRQRHSDGAFQYADPFEYKTVADGDLFRLLVLHPGTGSSPILCNLIWESARKPKRGYCCLSYAWESVRRDDVVLCDGYRLPADQICINQDDEEEKAHQVSIMRYIFHKASKIYVWLGEADDRSEKLFEYAKRMRRGGDDFPKDVLHRLLSQRELKDAIQKFLQRPWFQRVWVIPEVALSSYTTVVCGRSKMSWENLVRLIRDVPLPLNHTSSFDKQVSLLGNPRQRTAIITQMISSQKERLAHTDITQLLILAKSSRATDVRDMVYAFYGLTHLTTYPSYSRPVSALYTDITSMYISSIQWETSYSNWHDLSNSHRSFQLLSILYAAGSLHQHITDLPSWVPDLTHSWHLAPVWCRTIPNFIMPAFSAKDDWTRGIRTNFRAGGQGNWAEMVGFEIVSVPAATVGNTRATPSLKVVALLVDEIDSVNEISPVPSPGAAASAFAMRENTGLEGKRSQVDERQEDELLDSAELRYGRHFFTTQKRNLVGIATPGIATGDMLAVVLGGDVPFIFRPEPESDVAVVDDDDDDNRDSGRPVRAFSLLCEAYVHAPDLMCGDLFAANRSHAREVLLV